MKKIKNGTMSPRMYSLNWIKVNGRIKYSKKPRQYNYRCNSVMKLQCKASILVVHGVVEVNGGKSSW